MLSRVAETVYWLGRYVERAENTARIVNVNANLLMDLPKGMAPGWQPLITITGSEAMFKKRYAGYEERHVVRFLLGDAENSSSLISSLRRARENARTIRDILPREAWEAINELYLFARDNLQSGLSKRGRYAYLRGIFSSVYSIAGLLDGTMNHGVGYDFLQIGRNLERADMTTRIVDVRSASLLPEETAGRRPFENIQWVSVLNSLSAYQMYRRSMQVRVRRADVLRFLLLNSAFPRSVYRCVVEVEGCISRLPHNEPPLRALGRLKRTLQGSDVGALVQAELHEFIDQIQLGLGAVHGEIATSYFLVPTDGTARSAPSQAA
jgi:uncharacterized alpha-E superfamily protein